MTRTRSHRPYREPPAAYAISETCPPGEGEHFRINGGGMPWLTGIRLRRACWSVDRVTSCGRASGRRCLSGALLPTDSPFPRRSWARASSSNLPVLSS